MLADSLSLIRRTAVLLLAEAILDTFPTAELISGTTSDVDFSYDVVFPQAVGPEILPLIEQRMKTVMRSDMPLVSREMIPKNAAEYFLHHRQPLRAEMLRASTEQTVSLLQVGAFQEVLAEPHPESLDIVGALRLLDLAPVTRTLPDGSVIDAMRISGAAFADPMALKRFLKRREAAKESNHLLLGRQQDLFIEMDTGWLWTARGTQLRHLLLCHWRDQHLAQGYAPITSPRREPLSDLGSGHVEAFLHQCKPHSEPTRYCEFAAVYPAITEEENCGLLRTMGFTTDMATTFCHYSRAVAELTSSLQFLSESINLYGFTSKVYLVGRGPDYLGTQADWAKATSLLRKALESVQIPYEVDESRLAQDSPSIEFQVEDALGRQWAVGRLGIDLVAAKQLPAGQVVIRRSTFSSLERLVALLLESHRGELPFWLAPEQVRIIALGEAQKAYAESLRERCEKAGVRAFIDAGSDNLGKRIYDFEAAKVPYALIVGEAEEKKGTVSLRERHQKEKKGRALTLDEFLGSLNNTK